MKGRANGKTTVGQDRPNRVWETSYKCGLAPQQWRDMTEMSAGKSMNVFLCIGEASARAAVLLEAMGHVLGRGNRKLCGQPHW